MNITFEDYEKARQALTFEEMKMLHGEILDQIGNDCEAVELYRELVDIAVTYANIRAKWGHMTSDEKLNINQSRTMAHNSLIVHFDVLARYLKAIGSNPSWRDRLGYEDDDFYNRKRIGDFGCYIVFVNSVNAR